MPCNKTGFTERPRISSYNQSSREKKKVEEKKKVRPTRADYEVKKAYFSSLLVKEKEKKKKGRKGKKKRKEGRGG